MIEYYDLIKRLEVDYGQVVDVLASVGMNQNDGYVIPGFDEVASRISEQDSTLLAERAERGDQDRLVVAPYIGGLTLDRFLEKTNYCFVPEDMFSSSLLGTNGHIGDRLSREPAVHNRAKNVRGWSVGVLLGDTHDNKGNELPARGLVFAGKSFERQRFLAKIESLKLRRQGVDVQPVTLQELVIASLTYPDFDEGTTRLVHLPSPNIFHAARGKGPGILGMMISFGGHPGAPELTGSSVYIGTSSLHKKDPQAGARRILRLV